MNTLMSTLIKSMLRHLLTLCGGILISKGLISAETAANAISQLTDLISGVIVAGAGVGIASLTHSDAHTVAKIATKVQDAMRDDAVQSQDAMRDVFNKN